MELNITDFSTSIEKTTPVQTAELPIDTDFTVPDYLGPVQKILKCRETAFITSKQMNSNGLQVDGTLLFSVLYTDDENLLNSAEYEVPFQKSFEFSAECNNYNIAVAAEVPSHSCRAITERKITVKATLKLSVNCNYIEEKNIISQIENEHIETLCQTIKTIQNFPTTEKSLVIDEMIQLDESQSSIRKILRHCANILISSTKVLTDKVVANGELQLKFLYLDDAGEVNKLNCQFPFSQIIDIAGIGEDCICNIKGEICSLNFTTRTDVNGVCRNIAVVCRLELNCTASCTEEIPAVFDAYHTRYATEMQKESVLLQTPIAQKSETYLCKKKVEIPIDSAGKLIDFWCDLINSSTCQNEDKLMINGNILCSFITQSEDGGYNYFEKTVAFEYPVFENETSDIVCNPNVTVLEWESTTLGEQEIEIAIQLALSANINKSFNNQLITGITVDEEKPAIKDRASLIAYYAESGENLWNISKRFCADRNELKKLNNLDGDYITASKMIIIPR